jgi:hypothetical protein
MVKLLSGPAICGAAFLIVGAFGFLFISCERGFADAPQEENDTRETQFCTRLNPADFRLKHHQVIIDGKKYNVKPNPLKNPVSPFEFPKVKLISHIMFENREVTYANVLYVGDDGHLYQCRGGK